MHEVKAGEAFQKQAPKYVVGFLNAEGGRGLWGVDDGGAVVGIDIEPKKQDEQRQAVIRKLRDWGIFSNYHIVAVPVQGTDKVVLEVHCNKYYKIVELHVPEDKKRQAPQQRYTYVRVNDSILALREPLKLEQWAEQRRHELLDSNWPS